jgi:hypothetical protein
MAVRTASPVIHCFWNSFEAACAIQPDAFSLVDEIVIFLTNQLALIILLCEINVNRYSAQCLFFNNTKVYAS